MEDVDAGQHHDGQNDVHRRTGNGNQKALPSRMAGEFPRIAGARFHRVLAGHLDITAKRKQADPVVGVAFTESPKALSESQAENFNADAAQLRDRIMAKLMNENQYP